MFCRCFVYHIIFESRAKLFIVRRSKYNESSKLKHFQLKMLLQDIKGENFQGNEIVFLNIYEANEGLYGAKYSDNCRSFQKLWSHYQHMELPKHVETLYKHNITLREVTTRLFKQDDYAGKDEDEMKDANRNGDKEYVSKEYYDGGGGDDDHGGDDDNGGIDDDIFSSYEMLSCINPSLSRTLSSSSKNLKIPQSIAPSPQI